MPGPSSPRGIIEGLRALVYAIEDSESAKQGLNRTDVRCLELLANGPMQPKDLSAALGFTSGGITGVLNRLAQGGYIVRENPQEGDQRRRFIVATDKGKTSQIGASWADAFEKELESYSDDDLTRVREFLEAAQRTVRERRLKVLR